MTDESLQHQIDAATGYEALLVPALFEQWAELVLTKARVSPGQRVLDVACGTGVLAREALRRVGFAGSVAGVDPGPGMLTVAERLAPNAEWRQGTAESLPFDPESFDAVVSQFGLMFFPDHRTAIQEMVRVLRPGGHLAVAVWDSLEQNPAYATEVALLDRMAGADAAAAVQAPFVLGDQNALAGLFAGAGVSAVSVTTHPGTARFPSVRAMVEADLRGWLPVLGIDLEERLIEGILAEAERVLGEYVTEGGTVEFALSAHIVTGSKP